MRIKTIEKLMFRLNGRSVPVVKVADIEDDGKIRTIHFLGELKDRPNSIVNTWDEKGWEKDKGTDMITLIDDKGIKTLAHVVSEGGRTIDVYAIPRPKVAPNAEDILGKLAMADNIADSMDLGRSMRNTMLGLLVGMPLGYVVITFLIGIASKIMS